MRQRGRRRRKQTLQIAWIFVAVILSVILLLVYKFGLKESDQDSKDTIVNAAGDPGDNLEQGEPTLQATPTPLPTTTPTPVEQGPYQMQTPTPEADKKQPGKTEDSKDQNSTDDKGQNKPADEKNPEEVTDNGDAFAPEEQKLVALTFDDGPYPPVTSRILELLQKYDSHATFFVMGDRMDTYSDMMKQVFDAGNQIGNHTMTHKQLTKLSVDKIKYEVEHSNAMINQNAEVGDAYLRPPYGARNDTVSKTVKVPMILWSVDSLDWHSKNKDAIYKEIFDHVQDGDIILMHDLYSTTADAMEMVIPELIKQGYKLVTVEELLRLKGITAEAGVVYHNGRK